MCKLALALPDVEDATTPCGFAFKVPGKLLAFTAIHSSAEEGTLAVPVDAHFRATLIANEPQVFYVTPHYDSYPIVLVRLARIRRSAGSGQPSKPYAGSGLRLLPRFESVRVLYQGEAAGRWRPSSASP